MSDRLWYWLLMLGWMVFGLSPIKGPDGKWAIGKCTVGNILLFIILIILGWKIFGSPIHS